MGKKTSKSLTGSQLENGSLFSNSAKIDQSLASLFSASTGVSFLATLQHRCEYGLMEHRQLYKTGANRLGSHVQCSMHRRQH